MRKSLIVSLAVVVVVVAGGSAAVWYAYNNKYQDQVAVSTKTADDKPTNSSSANNKTSTPPAQTTNPGSSATPPAQATTPAPAPAAANGHDITITGGGFSPASLTVKKGTAVTWTNNDSAAHAITGSGLHSPQLKSGESYTYTFTQAGTYAYEDALVPGLSGSIIVTN